MGGSTRACVRLPAAACPVCVPCVGVHFPVTPPPTLPPPPLRPSPAFHTTHCFQSVGEIFDESDVRLAMWPPGPVNSTAGVGTASSILLCMHLPCLRQLTLAYNKMTVLPTRFGGVRSPACYPPCPPCPACIPWQQRVLSPLCPRAKLGRVIAATCGLVWQLVRLLIDLLIMRVCGVVCVLLQFASLLDLDLSNNELVMVPAGLGYMPQLRRLDLSNNKVRPPPLGPLAMLTRNERPTQNSDHSPLPLPLVLLVASHPRSLAPPPLPTEAQAAIESREALPPAVRPTPARPPAHTHVPLTSWCPSRPRCPSAAGCGRCS